MAKIKTFCRICEPNCGLIAEVNNGEVSLSPDREHPVHQGYACHKGIKYTEIHTDPDRLTGPLARQNLRQQIPAVFQPTDWDTAMADIARRIQAVIDQYGPNAVASYSGNPNAFNSRAAGLLPKLIRQLGSRSSFGAGTQDCANKWAASEAVFGGQNIHLLPDLDHTDYFLCLGSNPRVSHMTFVNASDPMAKIRGIVKRGGKVRYVNPRDIESASTKTGETVLIKPDTDVYFLASLLHEIYQQQGFQCVDKVHNLDALIDFIQQYPATKTEGVTGIKANAVTDIARDFCVAKAACIYMATGSNMQRQSTLSYWLLNMIALLTGNLDRPGGNIFSPAFYPLHQAGKKRDNSPYFDTALGLLRKMGGNLPGNLLADFIENDEQPIRALIVIGGNPILSVGGEQRLREAMQKLDLLVCIDIYRSATAELADYILPGTDWLERADINTTMQGLQLKPYVQYSPAIVPPRGDCKDEWWILNRLQQALGLPSPMDREDYDAFGGIDKLLAQSELSVEQLQQRGIKSLDKERNDFFTDIVQHPNHKADGFPADFATAIDQMKIIFEQLQQEPANQLKLISLRNSSMHNSWMQNMQSLKRGKHQNNPLWLNPEDAAERKLTENQSVIVSNANGRIEATVQFDKRLAKNTVAMTHGWGNRQSPGITVASSHPGVNVNQLLPSGVESFDPLSNQAFMTGIGIEVKAL